jgi:hypothetical protein
MMGRPASGDIKILFCGETGEVRTAPSMNQFSDAFGRK